VLFGGVGHNKVHGWPREALAGDSPPGLRDKCTIIRQDLKFLVCSQSVSELLYCSIPPFE
jgi:hypothetical protein